MDTILITGATGFLGSHLVRNLLNNYNVVILKRNISDLYRIEDIKQKLKIYDVEDMELVFKEQQIDIIIHTACCYGRKNEGAGKIFETNVLFGIKLLEYAIGFNVDTFINTDTFFNKDGILHNYMYDYCLSKKQFFDWIKYLSKDIQIINVVLEHMYGPKDNTTKFIPWIIDQLKRNVNKIDLTPGLQTRDFVFVDDVVAAYRTIINNKNNLDKFTELDVGTANIISVRKFTNEILIQYREYDPNNTTYLDFGAKPQNENEIMFVNVNNEFLKSFGWIPAIDYKKGIKLILEDEFKGSC